MKVLRPFHINDQSLFFLKEQRCPNNHTNKETILLASEGFIFNINNKILTANQNLFKFKGLTHFNVEAKLALA